MYDRAMYQFGSAEPSYWQSSLPDEPGSDKLLNDEDCEVAVIGAGFTGLSAALHLARDYGLGVTVVDAGQLAWGASGRNGGFCCLYPSKLGLATLERRYGLDETRRFLSSQCEAIDLVAAIAHDEGIDLQRQGTGIYEVAHKASRYRELVDQARIYSQRFGIAARSIDRQAFADEAYDSEEQFGALHLGVGFGLHPLAFARGLARAARRHGARLFAHSRVLSVAREDDVFLLRTEQARLRSRRLIIACNGYLSETLLPALSGRLIPVISNIITTRPLSERELENQSWHTEIPCANTRRLLFYYRLLPDRRMLFGARGDTTGRPTDAARMRRQMTRRFREVFPAWAEVDISHYWRGFVCMSGNGTPGIGELPGWAGAYYAGAYHGNGVCSATWSGRQLAALVSGHAQADDLPQIMRGPWPRIPLPGLRRWYLRSALLASRCLDAM